MGLLGGGQFRDLRWLAGEHASNLDHAKTSGLARWRDP